MDFHLTEQQLVRKMYREFAENEVKPLAAEIDEEERFPMETVEKMAKLGMMGIYFPKEYGGAAATCCPMPCAWRSWQGLRHHRRYRFRPHLPVRAPIFENGTEEQKEVSARPAAPAEDRRFRSDRAQRRYRRFQGQQTTAAKDETATTMS